GAIDPHLEQAVHFGSPQDGLAILARGNDGDLVAVAEKLVDEPNASLVSLDTLVLDGPGDQSVLAVSQAAHRLCLGRIVRTSFRKMYAARLQEIANAVEARLAVDMEAVVGDGVEPWEGLARLPLARPQIFVKHLFPAGRVDDGCIGDHTVQV